MSAKLRDISVDYGSAPLWLIVIGVSLTILGVGGYFTLEQLSRRASGISHEYDLMEGVVLPALFLGALVLPIGSFMWAWRASRSKVARAGAIILGAVALAIVVLNATIPLNVHDWSVSLGLAIWDCGFIGGVFLILAAARYISKSFEANIQPRNYEA